jgi:hypothetical protein
MLSRKRFQGLVLGTVLWGGWASQASAEPIRPEHFAKLHQMIKPQAGELRFWEIPWLLDAEQARAQAAAEGKPILVWSGAGGAPIGVC